VQQRLVETLQNLWSISPQFANTRQNAFGVRIAYQQPQRLGVDRWLVLIAAHRLRLGPVLVVDCGTAVTLDALAADGTHWGGLIIPGLRMVWESLFSNTRIAPIERDESTDVLGKNTNECITSGALQAVTGMIEKTRQDLHRRYGLDARILLTGSDAPQIAERLNGSFEHRPLLILEGLQLLKDAT
jgi:type III pantothenate kinase